MASGPLDVLIVGAGWSGLTAALQLSKAGKRVLCLEARKRLGGRAFTHSWNENTEMNNNDRNLASGEEGYNVDFGCSYIHGYEEGNPVKEIARKYSINVHVSQRTLTQIVDSNGPLPSDLNNRIQEQFTLAQGVAASRAKANRDEPEKSDSNKDASLASFLLDTKNSPLFEKLNTKEQRDQATKYARMLHIPLGTELEKISLNHWGYEKNFAGTDGMPEGGFTRMIAELAKDVEANGGQIQLGKLVKKVRQSGNKDGVTMEVIDADSATTKSSSTSELIEAKSAIITTPLAVLKTSQKNLFEPRLDDAQRQAIDKLTIGNLNKVLLTYSEPFWSQEIGTFVVLPSNDEIMSLSDEASPSLPEIFASTTMIVNSLCCTASGLPSTMTSPSLLAMIGGQAAKHIEKYSRLEVAKALDDYLSPLLSISKNKKGELKHTFYSRWGKQEFTRGATSTPVTISNDPNQFMSLAEPLWNGALYLSGEHTEVNHRGSIAGAVIAAQRSSDQVLKYLSSTTPSARH